MKTSTIFNGIYTISSPSGQRRTFKINTCKSGNLEGKRILSLLVGSDNNSSYLGFGFVDDNGIKVWRKYSNTDYEKFANCLWEMAANGTDSRFKAMGMELLLEGRCLICNRRLTTPESIRTGIGPVCSGKI